MDDVSYKRLCVSWLRLSLCQQQQSICSLFLSSEGNRESIGSLKKRQIVISADRGGVSDSAGLRVLLVRARLQELVFVVYFRVPFIRGILEGLCKRALPFLRGPRTSFVSFILAM